MNIVIDIKNTPPILTKLLEKAEKDLDECRNRISDVLNRVEDTTRMEDELMEIHVDALYSMMKEKGYDIKDIEFLMEIL